MKTLVAVAEDDPPLYHGVRDGRQTLCGLTVTTTVPGMTLLALNWRLSAAGLAGALCQECLELQTIRLRSISYDQFE